VRLRRKQLPDHLHPAFAAFCDVLGFLEPAKSALTEVMPSTRAPGRPLADALVAFEEGMEQVVALMPGWRAPDVEPEWSACDIGAADALERARRLREDAPEVGGFEGLIWTVEELLGPLEVFGTAAERFRRLGAR
jgi:hypothetical protein